MLRRLQAARRLGGLAAALPGASVQLDALCAVCGPAVWRVAAARVPPSGGEGCGAAVHALGAGRGFCAAAGSGVEAPPAPAAQRESATARGDASTARTSARAKRVPKTAGGRPKPDTRTVERLLELGWWDTAEEVEAMLTRLRTESRFAFGTAGPAIEWLVHTLGDKKHSSGRSLAAQAVHAFPLILAYSTSNLQRGWEVVTLPHEAGGLALPEEAAQRRVATSPQVLNYRKEHVLKRAAFLESLGVHDGRAAIARNFTFLGLTEEKLQSCADWFQSQGLDVKQMVSTQPQLLMLTPDVLSPKLGFLRDVVGLSSDAVLPAFLVWSLEGRLRPRWFYAVQRGIEQRYSFSTLAGTSDATYVKMANGLGRLKYATVGDVAALKAYFASQAFLAYMAELERDTLARLSAETRER